MPTLKTLLCAVDFSESSPRVADYAAALAAATKAEVVCLYVAPSLAEYVGFNVPQASLDSFVDDVVTSAEQSMTEFTAAYFKDIPVRGLVLAGYPAEEILRAADKHHADLIVMGTHGRTGIDRIIFGSVAERWSRPRPVRCSPSSRGRPRPRPLCRWGDRPASLDISLENASCSRSNVSGRRYGISRRMLPGCPWTRSRNGTA